MLWLLSSIASAHIPVIYIVGPDDDWCTAIDDALGGDVIMLLPGDYTGACDIVAEGSDPVGEMTSVQSFDASAPARFVHDGVSDHILSVSGVMLTLLQVDFGELPAGVTGVEVREGDDLTVRYCTFEGGDGAGIVQTAPVSTLRVLDNRFVGFEGVGIDLGCDGSCGIDDLLLAGNVVDGGAAALRVRTSGEAEVVDNNAFSAAGTVLDVIAPAAVVSRNHIDGAVRAEVLRFDSNIVRGDLAGTGELAFSTLLGGVDWTGSVEGNASVATDLGEGNVRCDAACFVDLEGGDFFPAEGSPLRRAVARRDDVTVDWCDNLRRNPASAGAVEGLGITSFGPVVDDYKALQDCRVSDDTTTTGTADPTGDTADPGAPVDEAGGCGCTAGPEPAGVGALLALLIVAVQGRRRGPMGGKPTGVG